MWSTAPGLFSGQLISGIYNDLHCDIKCQLEEVAEFYRDQMLTSLSVRFIIVIASGGKCLNHHLSLLRPTHRFPFNGIHCSTIQSWWWFNYWEVAKLLRARVCKFCMILYYPRQTDGDTPGRDGRVIGQWWTDYNCNNGFPSSVPPVVRHYNTIDYYHQLPHVCSAQEKGSTRNGQS